MKRTVMNFDHPSWGFFQFLVGEDLKSCKHDYTVVRKVLWKYFEEVDVDETIKFLQSKGGYCDCEVMFNCYPPEKAS